MGQQTSNPKQWQAATTSKLFYIWLKRSSAHQRRRRRCSDHRCSNHRYAKPPIYLSTEPPNHRRQPIHFLPNHIKAAHFRCNYIIQWWKVVACSHPVISKQIANSNSNQNGLQGEQQQPRIKDIECEQ